MTHSKLKSSKRLTLVALALGSALLVPAHAQKASATNGTPEQQAALRQKGLKALDSLPILFEQNMGQADAKARFMSRGSGYALALSPAGVDFSLPKDHAAATDLRMNLVGANVSAQITGVEQAPGITNYLFGRDSSKWLTRVPNFQKVKVANTLPGVDVVYYGNSRELEFDFDVAASANPAKIAMRFDGSKSLHIERDGTLVVHTDAGDICLKNPDAYQPGMSGKRATVEAKYVIAKNGDVRFVLGNYDRAKPLVIDPAIEYLEQPNAIAGPPVFPSTPAIQYSTFWGGVRSVNSSLAVVNGPGILGMGVDAQGAAYIYGLDTGFQLGSVGGVALGAGCPVANKCVSLFVTKFDPSKSGAASLIYTTLIPAVDVTRYSGQTNNGLYQAINGGFPIQALGVDASGDAYFTGGTDNPLYPTTSTAIQNSCFIDPSANDPTGKFCNPTAYVSELSPDGTTLLYSTMLGSITAPIELNTNPVQYTEFPAFGTSIAVDNNHIAYLAIAGYNGFPNTTAFHCNFGTSCISYFTVKLDTTKSGSSALIYSIPFNALGTESNMIVATDGVGNMYWSSLVCDAPSSEGPLGYTPITYNGYLTTPSFDSNQCLSIHKMDTNGNMVYASFLYGSTQSFTVRSFLTSIAADPDGRAYMAGVTQDTTWPNVNGLTSPTVAGTGARYSYLTAFDTTKTGTASLIYSTVLDSTSNVGDGVEALAINGCGSAALLGSSISSTFPLINPLPGAAEPSTYFQGTASIASIINTKLAGQSSLTFASTLQGGQVADYAVLTQSGSLYIAGGTYGGAQYGGAIVGPTATGDINLFPLTSTAYSMTPTSGGVPFGFGNTGFNAMFQVISGVAAPGCYELSAPELDFGSQNVNTSSAAQQVTLANTSSVPLHFTSVTPSTGYTETDNCGTTILENGSCTANVTFTPTITGEQDGTLTFVDSDVTLSQIVKLTGAGTATNTPLATLNPTNVPFNNQAVNTTSNGMVVVLTNPGTAPLVISSITLAGANPGDFAINTSACPSSLAVNASCNLVVTFTPASAVGYAATLTVVDNAANSPQTAALTGIGIVPPAPMPGLNGSTFPFGNQTVNTTSATQTVILSNNGNAPLAISSIAIAGANPNDFAIIGNTCLSSLAATTACDITISFTPLALGSRSATFTVTDNAAGPPQTATLTGTGTPVPAPVASLNPTNVPFGNQTVNTSSAIQNVVLTNTGNATLNISSTTLGGANPAGFSIAFNNCGSTVAVNAQCAISVSFTPTAAISYSATINITDNAAGSPQTVTLTGTGTPVPAPIAGLSPNPAVFPATPFGTTSGPMAVALSNTGNAALSISSLSITGANPTAFGETTSCGSSLGTNSQCVIAITFTPPSGAGTYTATLNVFDNAAGSPQSVTLTGTAVKATAAVAISNTSRTFTGSPLPVTVITTPLGLTVVTTYNGSTTVPSAVGSYPVVATVNDPNYQGSSSATLTINPVSTGPVAGTVILTTTAVLSKTGSGYQAIVTVRNTGTGTAQGVLLTAATLGAAGGTSFPLLIGNLAPGVGSGSAVVNFPFSAGADGAAVIEKFSGTYTGGTFGGSFRATLP